jgi:hypothetical protein
MELFILNVLPFVRPPAVHQPNSACLSVSEKKVSGKCGRKIPLRPNDCFEKKMKKEMSVHHAAISQHLAQVLLVSVHTTEMAVLWKLLAISHALLLLSYEFARMVLLIGYRMQPLIGTVAWVYYTTRTPHRCSCCEF